MPKLKTASLALVLTGALLSSSAFAGAAVTSTTATKAKPSSTMISFQIIKETLNLKKSDIKIAKLNAGADGRTPSVNLVLTKTAAEQMTMITKNNVGHRMALVINNKVISEPMIQTALGGEFQVTFNSVQEAKRFYERLIG